MSTAMSMFEPVAEDKSQAADELLALVYEELRKLAASKMAGEWGATSTLQPTALVHEAWLRLMGEQPHPWRNRAHFFAAATEAMRRILIDRARSRRALKRGAGVPKVDLSRVEVAAQTDDELLLLIDEALETLAREDPDSAALVRLRFFAGLDYEEAAQVMGISLRTAKRYWTFARTWLYRELSKPDGIARDERAA